MANKLTGVNAESRRLIGLLAAATKHHPDEQDRLEDLRRQLKASRVTSYLAEVLETEPRLSDGECRELIRMIKHGRRLGREDTLG